MITHLQILKTFRNLNSFDFVTEILRLENWDQHFIPIIEEFVTMKQSMQPDNQPKTLEEAISLTAHLIEKNTDPSFYLNYLMEIYPHLETEIREYHYKTITRPRLSQ